MTGLLETGESFLEGLASLRAKKGKMGISAWEGVPERCPEAEKSCARAFLLPHTAARKFLCFAQFSLYIPAALPDGPLSLA